MANPNCKKCKGTGKMGYVCGVNEDGTPDVNHDVCDCVLEEE